MNNYNNGSARSNYKQPYQQSDAQKKFLSSLNRSKKRLEVLQGRAATLNKNERLEVARLSMFLVKVDIGSKFYKKHKVKWTGFSKPVKEKSDAKPTQDKSAMAKSKAKAKARAKEKRQLSLFDK